MYACRKPSGRFFYAFGPVNVHHFLFARNKQVRVRQQSVDLFAVPQSADVPAGVKGGRRPLGPKARKQRFPMRPHAVLKKIRTEMHMVRFRKQPRREVLRRKQRNAARVREQSAVPRRRK